MAQPNNINMMSQLGFRFHVRKLPNVNWFVQSVMLPGLTVPDAEHATPFQITYRPGRTVEYDPLAVEFKVDEDLKTFIEIMNWMRGIGFPESYDEYKNNVGTGLQDAVMSDATLMILNSNMNASHECTFYDIFPINMSALQFNSTSSDVDYLSVQVSFRYLRYEIKSL
jgi:hypothetical protein